MSNLMMKGNLTAQEQMMVQSEFDKRKKNKVIVYLLWFCLCSIGAHRFYLGNKGYALCMLFFGWATAFIWNLVDVFFIGKELQKVNDKIEEEIITKVKVMKI